MQAAGGPAPVDRSGPESELDQLPACDDSVLPCGELGDKGITWATWAVLLLAYMT
jgi:hypothetical protein